MSPPLYTGVTFDHFHAKGTVPVFSALQIFMNSVFSALHAKGIVPVLCRSAMMISTLKIIKQISLNNLQGAYHHSRSAEHILL